MKRYLLIVLATLCSISSIAQEEEKKDEEEVKQGGFRKDMLFTGGNVNIGFFNGVTVLGATPQLGYSVTEWLDAGISLGYTYTSQSVATDYKVRQSIIGPGAFARIFPIQFLFASIQYEHNFIRVKQIISGNDFVN